MADFRARMLLRSDGERRLTNVRHLVECLHEASGEHPVPEALLRWLQRQRRDAVAGEAAQVRLESDRNLVQIVTIHKSKGLEYPVVFCPFLWNGHPGGGGKDLMGCEYHDEEGRPVIDYRDLAKDDPLRKRIRAEKDAERLRLIYVALTRAVHRCYVVVGSYLSRVGSNLTIKECTGNPLNWLVAGTNCAPTDWRDLVLTGEEVVHAWERLAKEHASVMALDPLPDTTGVALQPPALDPASLTARVLPRQIPEGWRRSRWATRVLGRSFNS